MKRFTEVVLAYLTFALIVIGIVGFTWETFRDDGWLEQGLGIVLDSGAKESLLATPMIIGILLVSLAFLRDELFSPGKSHPFFSNAIVYALVASGLYFSYQWITS